MHAVLAPDSPRVDSHYYALREGTLTLRAAFAEPALAEERVLELLGHAMIGAEITQPGETALVMAQAAGVGHHQLVRHLTAQQRLLLLYGARLAT